MQQVKDNVDAITKCRTEKPETESEKEFKMRMNIEFGDFKDKYPVVFEKATEGSLEMERFNYMLSMATKVEDKTISEHDASVKVGERLVDEFVKPQLNKK